MLVKLGVDISRLQREIRRALDVVAWAYIRKANEEAVITSTYEGNHSPGSLHYANQAFDVRLPKKEIDTVYQALRGALSKRGYDVVLEADHIHIEYDPK